MGKGNANKINIAGNPCITSYVSKSCRVMGICGIQYKGVLYFINKFIKICLRSNMYYLGGNLL